MSTTQLRGPALAPTAAPIAPAPAVGRFAFSGTGWGYYKIYMVNLLLTIATFGLYSPWAKVRNRRYLFGNALLDGHNFEFDARPTTILLSRIVVVAIITVASLTETAFNWLVAGFGVLTTLLLLLLPFVIVRGRAFNCRHTLHRSVRFRYLRFYWPTARLYLLWLLTFALAASWPVAEMYEWAAEVEFEPGDAFPDEGPPPDIISEESLVFAVAVLLAFVPLITFLRHRVQIDQLCFGKLQAHFQASFAAYLRPFGKVLLIGPALIAGLYIVFSVHGIIASGSHWTSLFSLGSFEFMFLSSLVLFALPITVWMIYPAMLVPVYWSSIGFADGTQLRSTATAAGYFWRIRLTNLVLIIASLGVLYPWAVVRRWRYLAEHIEIDYSASFKEISASADRELTPLGEEYADISGFDFDFGI